MQGRDERVSVFKKQLAELFKRVHQIKCPVEGTACCFCKFERFCNNLSAAVAWAKGADDALERIRNE